MIIIDVEASGLAEDSYPIEIAWSRLGDSKIHSYLIKPIETWTSWSPASEEVHRIPRHQLLSQGMDALAVAEIVEEQLAGELVYSDAPGFDQMWLSRLLNLRFLRSQVRLERLQMLWVERVLPYCGTMERSLAWIQDAREAYKEDHIMVHRAGDDVAHLKDFHVRFLAGEWLPTQGIPHVQPPA